MKRKEDKLTTREIANELQLSKDLALRVLKENSQFKCVSDKSEPHDKADNKRNTEFKTAKIALQYSTGETDVEIYTVVVTGENWFHEKPLGKQIKNKKHSS